MLAENIHLPTMLSKKAPRRCQSFLSFKKVIIWDRRTSLAFWRPKKTQRRVIPFSISVCFTIFSGSLSKVTTFCCTISCNACNSARANIWIGEKQHVHISCLLLKELHWYTILKNSLKNLLRSTMPRDPNSSKDWHTKTFRLSNRVRVKSKTIEKRYSSQKRETFFPEKHNSKFVITSTRMNQLISHIGEMQIWRIIRTS